MTNKQLLWCLVLILIFAVFGIKMKSDDMAICQLQNSHDVCFQTLHR